MSGYVDRREFLQLLSAAGAGATAACSSAFREPEYLEETLEPTAGPTVGEWVVYATTCRECPAGCGLWARTRAGRVLKLEGNPEHPLSRGALCPRGQAGVQGLYNPDRAVWPMERAKNGTLARIGGRRTTSAEAWAIAMKRLIDAVRGPIAAGRATAVGWLTGETSDSDADLVSLIAKASGMRRPVNLRLGPEASMARAAEAVFGYRGAPELRIGQATLLVSVGADFLETWGGNPVQQAFEFAEMHSYRNGAKGRAIFIGPRQSVTAANCDWWLPMKPGYESAALRVIVEGIIGSGQSGQSGLSGPSGLSRPTGGAAEVQALLAMVPVAEAEKALGGEAQRLRAIGQALAKAGPGALVIASGSGPDGDLAHALALLATHLAGATGRTILYPNPPRPPRGDSIAAVSSLLQDAASGAVEVLLIHEANPAYQLPSLAPLLEKARFVACFTTMPDETAAACADLVIPIDHPLETWGDHVSGAGVIGLLQPAMQPMFGTRAFADVLLEMAAGLPQQGEKQKDSGPPKGGTPNEELAKGGTPNEEPTTGGIPNEGPPKGGTPNKEPPNEEPPKGGTPNEGTAQPPAARQAAWPNARAYYESRLAAYHKTLGGAAAFADFEREAKRTGILKAEKIDATPVKVASGARLPAWQAPQQGVLSWLFPHPFLFDGRHANKPWLQEIPESTTTIVWDSWAEVHPVTAKEIGVEPGGSIVLGSGKSAIATPVYITTQVAPGVVAIPIGQGHEQYGRYATGRGVNPLRLIDATRAPGGLPLSGLPLKASAGPRPVSPLVRTSGGMDQGERNLARAVPLTETQRPETQRPDREGGALESEHGRDRPFVKDPPSLYPDHQHPVYDWSMVIDLDACIGCGACVVACHAENNVPVVGKERVRKGREMAWIRVEKYVQGDNEVRFLLDLCQHCHHAPCESVCPVHATYHNGEGLNVMIYNRCVGTRYCSNNCTYKVRRFNWFDYVPDPPLPLQLNPDVTVRERGMMEKCTFCIQRIQRAKEQAKNEGRPVRDGEVVPACAQTCPARAITFGNLTDPKSRVAQLWNDPRGYRLLGELGTRPSIVYLKKVIRPKEV